MSKNRGKATLGGSIFFGFIFDAILPEVIESQNFLGYSLLTFNLAQNAVFFTDRKLSVKFKFEIYRLKIRCLF
jgi:hypothetical protein